MSPTVEKPRGPDGLARIPEACDFLAVSRAKLYSMMDAELPYVKLGKSRRVAWTDLRKLVEVSRVG
jgi:excisionase family DNA binding protein